MKKIVSVFFVLFSIFSFSSASGKKEAPAQNVPGWVLDKNVDFPESVYLAQVAEGTSKAEAESKALGLLASYFSSTVNVQKKADVLMTEKDTNSKENSKVYASEKKFENSINIESEIELFGVDYKYYFLEKNGTHYALAFINREKTFKIIEEDLKKILDDSKNNYSNGMKAPDLFTKIRLLSKNDLYLEPFYTKYYFARVLDYDKALKYTEIQKIAYECEKEILKTKNNCPIKLDFKNENAKKIGKKANEIFESQGFVMTSGKALYHAEIDVEMDISQNGEWFVSYPKLSIEIFDSNHNTVHSYSQTSSRIVGIDNNHASIKTIKKLEEMLGDCLK